MVAREATVLPLAAIGIAAPLVAEPEDVEGTPVSPTAADVTPVAFPDRPEVSSLTLCACAIWNIRRLCPIGMFCELRSSWRQA